MRIGDKFPNITVQTTQGPITLPDDYIGKWVVLFSHPGDFTPVCTTEFVSFQMKDDMFKNINTELIGLSVDTVYAHLKWLEWIKDNLDVEITFPVIADPMGDVSRKLGMAEEGDTSLVRSVFIIDDQGIIRMILVYPKEVGRNIQEIYRAVKALQISDEYGVALPANWPKNELIGSDVILPPANTVQKIENVSNKEKTGEIDCYDWWFCYKGLNNNNNNNNK